MPSGCDTSCRHDAPHTDKTHSIAVRPEGRPSPDEAEQVIGHLRERGLGVDPVRRVLELSPAAYLACRKRPKSARRLRDEQLMPLIEEMHTGSRAT